MLLIPQIANLILDRFRELRGFGSKLISNVLRILAMVCLSDGLRSSDRTGPYCARTWFASSTAVNRSARAAAADN